MADSPHHATLAEAPRPVLLAWSVHPIKRNRLVSAGVISFLLVMPAIVWLWWELPFMGVLTFLVLFGSLAKFFFPTRYELTDQSVRIITMTQKLEKSYSIYRSLWPDKNGILLSPFAGQSRLEGFRGIYVMTERNQQAVVELLSRFIPSAADAQPQAPTPQGSR